MGLGSGTTVPGLPESSQHGGWMKMLRIRDKFW